MSIGFGSSDILAVTQMQVQDQQNLLAISQMQGGQSSNSAVSNQCGNQIGGLLGIGAASNGGAQTNAPTLPAAINSLGSFVGGTASSTGFGSSDILAVTQMQVLDWENTQNIINQMGDNFDEDDQKQFQRILKRETLALAKELHVAPEKVNFVRVSVVNAGNSSAANQCRTSPLPDGAGGVGFGSSDVLAITQMQVDDFQNVMNLFDNPAGGQINLVFEVDGKIYNRVVSIHPSTSHQPVTPKPTEADQHTNESAISVPPELKRQVASARLELARQLGVPVNKVELKDFETSKTFYKLTFVVDGKDYPASISMIDGTISVSHKPAPNQTKPTDEKSMVDVNNLPKPVQKKIREIVKALAKELNVSKDKIVIAGVYSQAGGEYGVNFNINGLKYSKTIGSDGHEVENGFNNFQEKLKDEIVKRRLDLAKQFGVHEKSVEFYNFKRIDKTLAEVSFKIHKDGQDLIHTIYIQLPIK